jgi:hypothetical protein
MVEKSVMFNFRKLFRNENVDDIVQAIKDRGTVMNYVDPVEVPERKEPKSPLFTVGKNDDGQTCLTVGYATSIILTLNDASVAYLIKQLAVNIDHTYNVTVATKEND